MTGFLFASAPVFYSFFSKFCFCFTCTVFFTFLDFYFFQFYPFSIVFSLVDCVFSSCHFLLQSRYFSMRTVFTFLPFLPFFNRFQSGGLRFLLASFFTSIEAFFFTRTVFTFFQRNLHIHPSHGTKTYRQGQVASLGAICGTGMVWYWYGMVWYGMVWLILYFFVSLLKLYC